MKIAFLLFVTVPLPSINQTFGESAQIVAHVTGVGVGPPQDRATGRWVVDELIAGWWPSPPFP